MKNLNFKPTALLVPFSYPDYPQDVIDKYINESRDMFIKLGINTKITPKVLNFYETKSISEFIRKADYDFLVPILVSWVETPNFTATLREFFNNKDFLLWSHTSYMDKDVITITGSLPAAGVIRETLEEMNVKFKFIYGQPYDKKLERIIKVFAKAAMTKKLLSNARVGLFGYISMGMYTASFDHFKIKSKIGTEVDHMDQYVIINEMSKISDNELIEDIKNFKNKYKFISDIDDSLILKALKMYRSLKKLKEERKLDGLTIKCQYDLSRVYGFAPCVPLSMLADDSFSCSCEGDVYTVVTQLMLHYLTGKEVSFGEIFNLFEDGFNTGHCGFAPFNMAAGKPEIVKHCWSYEGIGNSSEYKHGDITLARLANKKDSFKLHVSTGKMISSPPFTEIGAAKYCCGRIVLNGDLDHFLQNMASQHYSIVYDSITDELIELCKLLDIEIIIS